ncbi:UDP-4-amino-4,6-dideoxy-N-acetyl-beta-L-altrosamine transaminase [candidate division WOR-1 bacterium RIFOXYC2_FULL_37_10]|uniref:UDP-4-amino-4, 6-dideoxy-N-acetyl-beta-L-altrosamine transaminase n=1 Tax=candidate division WOR-1 bacterium RIFOXYB2_FULL_37_13 TaxID=1802579 RepID=A0A1F4SSG0_UNCSA|nr:MAG: UDP-4-amino-4,6-dideoxy-N-acetyl-beta-L-altrosamine transaminase [candidate division WOR-1 bacterium RIFOXYB2_FULL_37_13]OGC34239.1 MAG: UDP-4-amino-4,6-dideoxy-N-acetyl-beta-L-altrosamine transaminase [candidate division WOR-1 bacterium RIFOXYC2_FULL_37_10]
MKYIPYAKQWILDDDVDIVADSLRSDYLTQGSKVLEFENKTARYCGTKYAVAMSSGTAALHAAAFVAGIKHGDEVITSPITFVASANCVLYCGGKPVFADIEEDTINIDPNEITKKITTKTKAIIPVHFAGHPCDLEEIHDIAKKHNLIIIEDACHALGAEYNDSKIGACKYSDMTVLSFHAVKHITTGEGGMILTNNENYYKRLLMFRTHGITRDPNKIINSDEGDWYYEMQFLGFNYRITDFQCALGISQLKKLGQFIERRREIVKKYNEEFDGLEDIILPVEKQDVKSSWHLYYIRVKRDRKAIFKKLREEGIGVNVHYIPVYYQPYYKNLGYKDHLCPKAEDYYDRTITLPLYPKMTDNAVDKVIEIMRKVVA